MVQRFFLACALARTTFSCVSDLGCSLNGVCVAGACECDAAWHGPSCELLSLLPSAPGDGTCDPSLNGTATGFTTTWGGHPMQDADGSWHLQAAEMAQHCGMCSWGSVSQVAHWASGTLAGPYSRVGTAVGAFAHNPAVVAAPTDGNASFLLMWHIGIGCDSAGVHACNYTRMPSCANGSTPLHPQPPLKPVPNPPNLTRAVVHMAARLSGPWAPVPPSWKLPSCNNPSPLFLRNGSLMVMCHGPYSQCPHGGGLSFFTSHASVDWRFGPFAFHCLNILNPNFTFNGTIFHPANEDPHLWQDARGALHVLTHNQSPCYSGPVAAAFYGADVRGCGGHFFSADGGLSWTFSWRAAYNGTVHFTDGRVRVYKRERPKLVQDAQGAIIALANGVGPALVDAFRPGNDTACSLVVAVGR